MEEFYDLVNDPAEDVNLINSGSFSSQIQSYRAVLDSIRNAVNDYTPGPTNCNLSNPQKDFSNGDENENINDRILRLRPSPADSHVLLSFNAAGNKEDISVVITNALGAAVFHKKILHADIMNLVIDCKEWQPGFYVVTLNKGNQTYTEKLVVNR